MKKTLLVLLFLSYYSWVPAQKNVDSLQQQLQRATSDSSRVFYLCEMARAVLFSKPDSAKAYAEKALSLSNKNNYKKGQAQSLTLIGNVYSFKSNYTKAFETHILALKIYEELKDLLGIGATYNNIAIIYDDQAEYRKALINYLKTNDIFEKLRRSDKALFDKLKINKYLLIVYTNIGSDYEQLNELDSALYYQTKAYDHALNIKDTENLGVVLTNMANVNHKLGKKNLALQQYRSSFSYSEALGDYQTLADACYGIATLYQKTKRADSALFYARKSVGFSTESSYLKGNQKGYMLISDLYADLKNSDSAFAYFKLGETLRDSIVNNDITRQLQQLSFNEQLRQREIAEEKQQYQTKLKFYALAGVLLILIILAVALIRNIRHKQVANKILQQQKEKTETALADLKAAQARLIQSEKMASLGELTAGIAHEIQNPLNFVNNFSEVNADLIEEMKEMMKEGKVEDITTIADLLRDNSIKIASHGKKADAIVKGMLEHSRNTGKKEVTDINKLTQEFLDLSYHGMRIKDKTFNAALITQFDEKIGKVNVNPQYIGRVLLNLLSNAFYSVGEKKKRSGEGFEPTIWVSTHKMGDSIRICIKDNGMGIPKNILDKIYQPFFTTKPTGEGTGLGLSLSYDIITKEHGGDLKVATQEGEFAEFMITLPA